MNSPPFDERALIGRLESSSPDEMMTLLRNPSTVEERAYRAYLGDETYQAIHVLALRRGSRGPAANSRGNVVVVHGALGAELLDAGAPGGERVVWPRYIELARGGFDRLALDGTGRDDEDPAVRIVPGGILKRHYGQLLAFLALRWRCEAFFYDWRKDLAQAAAGLHEHVTRWFAPGEPFHIVAHGVGGVVARNYIARYAPEWIATSPGESGGGRLVMLGTPNHGSFAALQLLTGAAGLAARLSRLDSRHDPDGIRRTLATFPAFYQMLPSPLWVDGAEPLYRAETYEPLELPQRHLESARRWHTSLEGAVAPGRMFQIIGVDQPTPDGVDHLRLPQGSAFTYAYDGDGVVSRRCAYLEGLDAYYVREGHGAMIGKRQVHQAVEELLQHGQTAILSTEPPTPTGRPADADPARSRSEDHTLLDGVIHRSRSPRNGASVEPVHFSSEERRAEEILLRGWLSSRDAEAGKRDRVQIAVAVPELRVNVLNGLIQDPSYLTGGSIGVDAIAVGHYRGVKPAAAELAIDKAISEGLKKRTGADGEIAEGDLVISQLSERGTIRGDLGQPFFLPDFRDTSRSTSRRVIALAGMGMVGRFGVPELTVLVRELTWALGRMGKQHLAAVLIGSGNGNLSVEDAVGAWVRGLKHALTGSPPEVQLRELTIVEYQPQRVLQIDRELSGHAEQLAAEGRMRIYYTPLGEQEKAQLLDAAKEFERRALEARLASRHQVRPDDLPPTRVLLSLVGNTYRFAAMTASASVPEREVTLDRGLVEEANDQLAGEWDSALQKERGAFMERLLIPEDLRPHLTGHAPIVLTLNSGAARVHWELVAQPDSFADANPVNGAPSGVLEAGFLGMTRGFTRQLRTSFAPPPEPPPPPQRHLRVLIVADPAEDARLAGAEEEGAEVAEIFELYNTLYPETPSSVEVVRLLGPHEATRTRVLRELLLRHYDVLHFAGHCRFDADHADRSGWIFSGGSVLSAHELNRIDRIPSFVFSNACESGVTLDRSELRNAALAPSFAEAFFARGVVNFVCTAWPIDDLSARLFALTLYGNLLGIQASYSSERGFEFAKGRMLPMHAAMREARRSIAGTPAGVRTWGAYQHYGNPNFRFFLEAPTPASPAAASGAHDTGKKSSSRSKRSGAKS